MIILLKRIFLLKRTTSTIVYSGKRTIFCSEGNTNSSEQNGYSYNKNTQRIDLKSDLQTRIIGSFCTLVGLFLTKLIVPINKNVFFVSKVILKVAAL